MYRRVAPAGSLLLLLVIISTTSALAVNPSKSRRLLDSVNTLSGTTDASGTIEDATVGTVASDLAMPTASITGATDASTLESGSAIDVPAAGADYTTDYSSGELGTFNSCPI